MNLLLCAILLHGLGRGPGSMNKMQHALENRGYVVWNEGYPSTSASIVNLARVIDQGMKFCGKKGPSRVDIVTHSMGGILVRQYFQLRSAEKIGAVVMLAPPNHGSPIVDAFRNAGWFRWAMGPAALELGTGPDSLVNRLGPVPLTIGIIAGTSSSDPWFSYLFSGENDGKVSVESAKLSEMKDFLTVPAGHTFLMNSDEAIRQALYFLENGSFDHPAP